MIVKRRKRRRYRVLDLLKDRGVPHSTTHHHCTRGWVQLRECPWCGSENYHLGLTLDGVAANCWRCGPHPVHDTLALVLGTEHLDRVLRRYVVVDREEEEQWWWEEEEEENRLASALPPPGTGPLSTQHLEYLRRRGFSDPLTLAQLWDLRGTGPTMAGPWKNRIVIPVYDEQHRRVLTYVGRDITEKHPRRYLFTQAEHSVRTRGEVLYGLDRVPRGQQWIVVVEGPVDVWRLGPGTSVATLGVAWTEWQVLALVRHGFRHIFILYDRDAVEEAKALAHHLAPVLLKGTVEVLTLHGHKDPGELSPEEAHWVRSYCRQKALERRLKEK